MTTLVTIVSTEIANLASVKAAMLRCGVEVRCTQEARRVADAELLVLPGVGSFGTGMRSLSEKGLQTALTERLRIGAPTLAICLGLQLLCLASEETPGVAGLGSIAESVERLSGPVAVPQFGWNWVSAPAGSSYLTDGYAYFANSYCLKRLPAGWSSAVAEYGEEFVAAVERGRILGCQFHPELSGAWGRQLLTRWIYGERRKESVE